MVLGVKDMLSNDCKDLFSSGEWYAEFLIPFRRGYLLHCVPAPGKTSLIFTLWQVSSASTSTSFLPLLRGMLSFTSSHLAY